MRRSGYKKGISDLRNSNLEIPPLGPHTCMRVDNIRGASLKSAGIRTLRRLRMLISYGALIVAIHCATELICLKRLGHSCV